MSMGSCMVSHKAHVCSNQLFLAKKGQGKKRKEKTPKTLTQTHTHLVLETWDVGQFCVEGFSVSSHRRDGTYWLLTLPYAPSLLRQEAPTLLRFLLNILLLSMSSISLHFPQYLQTPKKGLSPNVRFLEKCNEVTYPIQ